MTMERLSDIITRKDIELLVDKFYERVKEDELLGPLFSHVDWAKHLPIMYSFWSSMMLGEQSYRGDPFQKHVNLPIQQVHFTTWLKLFVEIVDENFAGDKAMEIKVRAQNIAQVFQHRMNLINHTL
jgi:hemoglobin